LPQLHPNLKPDPTDGTSPSKKVQVSRLIDVTLALRSDLGTQADR
jgi:hypothetical protein